MLLRESRHGQKNIAVSFLNGMELITWALLCTVSKAAGNGFHCGCPEKLQ